MGFCAFLVKNLLRRKVRSLLTTLAIALAVGTQVTLLGISEGFENAFRNIFSRRGVDLVVLSRDEPLQITSELNENIGEKIKQIPGVRAVDRGLTDHNSVDKGHTSIPVLIQGWDADSIYIPYLKFLSGRSFHEGEKGVCLLGSTLAMNLQKSVGDTVKAGIGTFEVIGVFEGTNVFENGFLVVPLKQLQIETGKKGKVTGFSVFLNSQGDPDLAREVRTAIENLTDEHGKSLRLSAPPLSEYVNGSLHIQLAHAMAWMTSVIAIVMGAVGMLNTMLMAVFERIKEIGILRAIGWRRWRVMRMILGESLLLSLTGAGVGIIAAILVTLWLTSFPQVNGYIQGDFTPLVFCEGVLVAMVVGLIGGIYPAMRAANLKPTEALRHE